MQLASKIYNNFIHFISHVLIALKGQYTRSFMEMSFNFYFFLIPLKREFAVRKKVIK